MSEVLINCENAGKKFCRDLAKSISYGLKDSLADVFGRRKSYFAPKYAPQKNVVVSDLRPGEFWANNAVSFKLRRGECIGLVGANGAGKTTLLKMLNGLIKPDKGRITIKGSIGAIIALGAGFNPILSGRENIYVNGLILGLTKKEISEKLEHILAFADIGSAIDDPVRTYSSGMNARLGFAIPAIFETDVLLVDEVLAVGDVAFRMKCYDLMKKRLQLGAAVVLVSHNELDLMRLCDRGILLSGGVAISDGDLTTVLRDYSKSRLAQIADGSANRKNAITFVNTYSEDATGNRKSEFSTHDDITLVAKIICSAELSDVRVLFHIDDARVGRLCSASSSCDGVRRNLPIGESEIRIALPAVPLLQGAYRAVIDIYGPAITDYYGVGAPIELQIDSPRTDPFGFGMYHSVHIPHIWIKP